MTAIGGGDGDALVPYSLETTIDVEVGWGGRGGLMDIVESRYCSVCGVCPRSGWQRKMNQLDLWAKKGNGYKI